MAGYSFQSKPREKAFTSQNIRSGWSKAGLFPFNPAKVLQYSTATERSGRVSGHGTTTAPITCRVDHSCDVGRRKLVVQSNRKGKPSTRRGEQRGLSHAAYGAIAGKSLLLAQNDLLWKQNDEKKVRKSVKSNVISTAKVMSYRDLKALEEARNAKETAKKTRKPKTKTKATTKKQSLPTEESSRGEQSCSEEADRGTREMEAKSLADYCCVL